MLNYDMTLRQQLRDIDAAEENLLNVYRFFYDGHAEKCVYVCVDGGFKMKWLPTSL